MLKIITFHFLYSYYMLIYGHFPKISSLPCPPTLVRPGVRLTSGAELEAPVVVNVAGPHSSQITAMALDSVSNDMTISTRAMRQAMTATVGHNGILIYGGFHKWDYTSWMVYNLENPTEIFWFVLIYFGICWSLMILGVHMFLSLDVLLFMCFPHVLSCVSPFVFVLPPFWWLFEFVSIEFPGFHIFVHCVPFFFQQVVQPFSLPSKWLHEWTTVGWHYFYRCSLILLHGFPFLLRDVPFLSISPMVNGSSGDIRVS